MAECTVPLFSIISILSVNSSPFIFPSSLSKFASCGTKIVTLTPSTSELVIDLVTGAEVVTSTPTPYSVSTFGTLFI